MFDCQSNQNLIQHLSKTTKTTGKHHSETRNKLIIEINKKNYKTTNNSLPKAKQLCRSPSLSAKLRYQSNVQTTHGCPQKIHLNISTQPLSGGSQQQTDWTKQKSNSIEPKHSLTSWLYEYHLVKKTLHRINLSKPKTQKTHQEKPNKHKFSKATQTNHLDHSMWCSL